MPIKFHREPAVVKALFVNPGLGSLFRVEESGIERVLGTFHGGNKWSAIFSIAERINFKHILQTLVGLKCFRMDPSLMVVKS